MDIFGEEFDKYVGVTIGGLYFLLGMALAEILTFINNELLTIVVNISVVLFTISLIMVAAVEIKVRQRTRAV